MEQKKAIPPEYERIYALVFGKRASALSTEEKEEVAEWVRNNVTATHTDNYASVGLVHHYALQRSFCNVYNGIAARQVPEYIVQIRLALWHMITDVNPNNLPGLTTPPRDGDTLSHMCNYGDSSDLTTSLYQSARVRGMHLDPITLAVRFYPNVTAYSADASTQTTIGRYLRAMTTLPDDKVADLEAEFRAAITCEINFAQDRDEWKAVYNSRGISACMSTKTMGSVWACDAYIEAPFWKLAYLGSTPATARARAIVYDNPETAEKCYIRVYGDAALTKALKRDGFVHGWPYMPRLAYVKASRHVAVPYLDAAPNLQHPVNDRNTIRPEVVFGSNNTVYAVTDPKLYARDSATYLRHLYSTGSGGFMNTSEITKVDISDFVCAVTRKRWPPFTPSAPYAADSVLTLTREAIKALPNAVEQAPDCTTGYLVIKNEAGVGEEEVRVITPAGTVEVFIHSHKTYYDTPLARQHCGMYRRVDANGTVSGDWVAHTDSENTLLVEIDGVKHLADKGDCIYYGSGLVDPVAKYILRSQRPANSVRISRPAGITVSTYAPADEVIKTTRTRASAHPATHGTLCQTALGDWDYASNLFYMFVLNAAPAFICSKGQQVEGLLMAQDNLIARTLADALPAQVMTHNDEDEWGTFSNMFSGLTESLIDGGSNTLRRNILRFFGTGSSASAQEEAINYLAALMVGPLTLPDEATAKRCLMHLRTQVYAYVDARDGVPVAPTATTA